jgi:hypothetical protein
MGDKMLDEVKDVVPIPEELGVPIENIVPSLY